MRAWGRRQCFRALPLVAGMTLASTFALERSARAEAPSPIAIRTAEELHEGCPRSPSLVERLTARLQRIHEAADDENAVRVEIRVERIGGLSHGRLTLGVGSDRAEREASSPSCEEVVSALAVMAAIGLDEGALPAPAGPPTPSVVTPARPPPKAPALVAARPAPSKPRGDAYPALSLATAIQSSANRAVILMPALSGEIGFRSVLAPSIRLGVGRSVPESFVTPQGAARVQWTELLLDSCVELFRVETLRAGPCLNAEVGRLDVVVRAPLQYRSQSRWWVTAGGSAKVSWQLHRRFSLELSGGVRVPVIRDRLFFEPSTVVYEPPAAVPFAGVAFVAHLR
jgi:hypothetical protein